ncbi:PREDICTED: uncharacterized protein LOC107171136 [Diuraphis noxia]|uniref:uncharacterized protein LOC107171136 n=1 Tax=Diuraphis noxia TaxID=143948 RepID=UPI0007636D16|nr:PREDICTED: uncharacterized protein LOC107171136 [Diuraphis noxia]
MATGESLRSLAFSFRISQSYISRIIQVVLKSLSKQLTPILLKSPTKENLIRVAENFWNKWNFPNCVGAIDGKHIRIFAPGKSGSLFYNYKDYFSIVLLAIVDADCKFIYVDIGSYGKEGDSGIFNKSIIAENIRIGDYFPSPGKLPNSNEILPYVHIGDEAFRLDRHMMRPYSRIEARKDYQKTIFNYRLSRARRTTENSFGILSQVFRVFYTPISLKTETVDNLVLSACCLHNILRDRYLENTDNNYYNFDVNELPPSRNMTPLTRTGGNANFEGFVIRDKFKSFFNSPLGAVEWQNHQAQLTDTQ